MRVNVFRGQNHIGGNIIEITTDKTRILLDVGLELDDENIQLPDVEGLFSDAAFDAVFISHYHGDHLGLAYYIDNRIPLYMGDASYRIVRPTAKRCYIPGTFAPMAESLLIGCSMPCRIK